MTVAPYRLVVNAKLSSSPSRRVLLRRSEPFSSPEKQRGAAALFLAVSLIGLMMAVAFALELGMIYNSRAELRKQAEVVAETAISLTPG